MNGNQDKIMKNKHKRESATIPSERRRFLKIFATALGSPIVFGNQTPPALVPHLRSQEASGLPESKRLLTMLSDRPLNAETPVRLLDDAVTPNHLHFVRNNGHIPNRALCGNLNGWRLTVDGEVRRPRRWTLDALQREFEHCEAQITIECAGNGRAGFHPPTPGNQWTLGAVGCARYRGVRLADVLNAAGLKNSARYVAYYGEDPHLSRDPKRDAISRGVPIQKALDHHTLLAWEMNGKSLPPEHGFPLRLLCPGWPGSTCGKWIRRLWVRDRVHDGAKMTGSSYRMPKHPVAPGETVPEADMEIITLMPVKSIITHPETRSNTSIHTPIEIRGKAWSGTGRVQQVEVSLNFGARWHPTTLSPAPNRYAWQSWTTRLQLPGKGYYEIWARATDDQGNAQPMILPGWNPKGYLNNAMHRIAVHAV